MRIRLVDNSGVWTDLIQRRRGASFVIKTHFLPDRRLARYLGQELVYSVRGTRKHNFTFSRVNGKVMIHRLSAGTYSYGIAKRFTPEGEEYVGLLKSTMSHRKFKGIKRGQGFEMRETSKHIFEGIKILQVSVGRTTSSVDVGWTGHDDVLVNMFMKGFNPVDTLWFGKYPPDDFFDIKVEPRRVKGIQQEYEEVVYQTMLAFLRFE